jgi:hypothetical protein
LITVQIEYTFEDYILDEWLENNNIESHEFDEGEHLSDFVDDVLGIWCDSARML